jgi:hypothetical protein
MPAWTVHPLTHPDVSGLPSVAAATEGRSQEWKAVPILQK